MISKRCSKCFTIKPLSNYSRQHNGMQGRKSECKKCQVIANKAYRHNKKAGQRGITCWKCGKTLSKARASVENKRIAKEGFGAKLPQCSDCVMIF